jgi:hypothetical protein
MKPLLLLLLLSWALPLTAETARPWVSLDVKTDRETILVTQLEAKGIPVIGWSNALVEVSAFGPLETVPAASLGTRLTSQDPRWDPWLAAIKATFVPRAGVSRLWVAESQRSAARDLLSSEVLAEGNAAAPPVAAPSPKHEISGSVGPRLVTGWVLVLSALLYLLFRLLSELSAPEGLGSWRRWLWALVPVVVLGAGIVLAAGPLRLPMASVPVPANGSVSWSRHLWFQQALPYGARWSDWKPGKAWSYPAFERKDGRITPVDTPLPAPDAAWVAAAFAGLDPHHAARIFGPENP